MLSLSNGWVRCLSMCPANAFHSPLYVASFFDEIIALSATYVRVRSRNYI